MMIDARHLVTPVALLFAFLCACDPLPAPPGSTSAASSAGDHDETPCTTGTTGDGSGSSSGGEPTAPECDIEAQDCAEGQKCLPQASVGPWWDTSVCSPVDNLPLQVGDTCEADGAGFGGADDCALGLMCWDVDPATGVGVCVDLCSDDADPCEGQATACTDAPGGGFAVCLETCDPLLPACPAGQHCAPAGQAWTCVPDIPSPPGAYANPCEVQLECGAGLVCVSASDVPGCAGVGCCAPVCDVVDPSGDDQCPAVAVGETCEPWYPEGLAPPGYEDVGVCRL